MKEMLGGCCVCADENGWTDNPLIYCDGPNCEVAVHQGCYGIQEVPEGEWLCAKCNATASTSFSTPAPETNNSVDLPMAAAPMNSVVSRKSFRCELCPSSYGALKKTEDKGWAHVICALYIPEVKFGDVHSMEPVILSDVPTERFEKLCYICDAMGKRGDAKLGACMSCNKHGCKRGFHVTCAQQKGLLCEEGGISKNVKYCGYCENHLRKAQNDPSIKVIPACPAPRPQPQTVPTKPQQSPLSLNNSHMLADPLPRPEQINSVLGFGSNAATSATTTTTSTSVAANSAPTVGIGVTEVSNLSAHPTAFNSTTTFSPPLTSSSRSSVALDTTPPLVSAATSTATAPPPTQSFTQPTSTATSTSVENGMTTSQSEASNHQAGQNILQPQTQQQQQQMQANDSQNGGIYPSNAVNNYFVSFQNELASRLPASVVNMLPGGADFHLNGAADLEETTVKAVLTPLTKVKRMRETKNDIIDKSAKRARTTNRPLATGTASSAVNSTTPLTGSATVGKSASMQRLISLVAPVVSETVSDFQRDRVADRTAAERRAAAAMTTPSTSANVTVSVSSDMATPPSQSNGHQMNGVAVNVTTTPSSNGAPSANGGSASRTHSTLPSSMEQLLERQWEQGSQLLMSQAHFDVAQLLSCLHQLKTENIRLEEQLAKLTKRREHLIALNQRLSQPFVAVSSSPTASTNGLNRNNSPFNSSPQVAPATSTPASDELSQLRLLASQVSRPTPTQPPIHTPTVASSAAAPSTTFSSTAIVNNSNNRSTPSTAGQAQAATPIMSSTTSNTTRNSDCSSNLTSDRLAQLSALNNIYRNPMMVQDPNLLTQLVMNHHNYLNQTPTSLSANMLSHILQQPSHVIAAAIASASNSQQQQSQNVSVAATAASNGK